MTGPGDSRAAILAAAADAIVDGSGDFEMNDVARRARVSVAVVYQLFRSKTGLVAALVAEFFDAISVLLGQRHDPKLSWRAREQKRLEEASRYLFDQPLAQIVLSALRDETEIVMIEAAWRESTIEELKENLREGQARGEISPDIEVDYAATLINGGLREAAAYALSRPERPSAEAFAERAWMFISAVLGFAGSDTDEMRWRRLH